MGKFELPQVPESNRVIVGLNKYAVLAEYLWESVAPSSEDSDDNNMVCKRGMRLKLNVRVFEKTTNCTEIGTVCIKDGRKLYKDLTPRRAGLFTDKDVLDLLLEEAKPMVRNYRQVHNAILDVIKAAVIIKSKIGESSYGESRLTNVGRFSLEDIEALKGYSTGYNETEFDVDAVNKLLSHLRKVAPELKKPKVGKIEEVYSTKFIEREIVVR